MDQKNSNNPSPHPPATMGRIQQTSPPQQMQWQGHQAWDYHQNRHRAPPNAIHYHQQSSYQSQYQNQMVRHNNQQQLQMVQIQNQNQGQSHHGQLSQQQHAQQIWSNQQQRGRSGSGYRGRGRPFKRRQDQRDHTQDQFTMGSDGSKRRHPVGRRGRGKHSKQQSTNNNEDQKKTKRIFYCCACERGFATKEEQDVHNSEHIICGLDGCQFEAHALVVTKHIKMQHSGGLYERIKNLKTPEDIERWREERKKKYPTFDNLLRKEGERKEKKERGEVFPGGEGGSLKRQKRREQVFRYRIRPGDDQKRMLEQRFLERKLSQLHYQQGYAWATRMFKPPGKKAARRKLVPFSTMNKSPIVTLEGFYLNVKLGKDTDGPLQKENKVKWKGFKAKTLERLPNSDSEGDEMELPISNSEEEDDDQNPKTSKTQSNPSLLSLVNYGSASESEDEDKEENTQKESSSSSESESKMVIEEFSVARNQSCPKTKTYPLSLAMCRGGIARKKTMRMGNRPNSRRTRLFERLLQDPIRRERNVTMQASRFFVENNFFVDAKTVNKEVVRAPPPETMDEITDENKEKKTTSESKD